jgi:hypothetical protein
MLPPSKNTSGFTITHWMPASAYAECGYPNAISEWVDLGEVYPAARRAIESRAGRKS